MRRLRVVWRVDGLRLVGILRLPDAHRRLPAVVLTGPFTGTKDQVVGIYAEHLARQGLVTLAFDHRGFGESDGRRGHEDSAGKQSDLRAAVSLLAGRAEVDADRIAVVGVCLGAGYALRAAAFDPRLAAVATVAGAYNSPVRFAEQLGLAGYRDALRAFVSAEQDEFTTGVEHTLSAISVDGTPAAMAGAEPYSYYGTERSRSPHWENRVTYDSLYSLLTLDTMSSARLLDDTPLLMVHGTRDGFCTPQDAATIFDLAPEPKQLRWVETTCHVDLYDREPCVTQAVEHITVFLRQTFT
jgi:fermentation-respiration switch protein FrsA (DUF1100 family)